MIYAEVAKLPSAHNENIAGFELKPVYSLVKMRAL
jgi:hypothetical protein